MGNLNPFQRFIAQPGIMAYELVEFNGITEFAFCIKEETKYIKRHKYPLIQLRMGMLKLDNVFVVPMMILVNNDYDMLYETMFNYYQTGGGAKYIDTLKNQDTIKLLFFNENNEEARQIQINNTIRDDITEIAMRLSSIKEWSMNDFDRAKEKLYEIYPTPLHLWNILGNKLL